MLLHKKSLCWKAKWFSFQRPAFMSLKVDLLFWRCFLYFILVFKIRNKNQSRDSSGSSSSRHPLPAVEESWIIDWISIRVNQSVYYLQGSAAGAGEARTNDPGARQGSWSFVLWIQMWPDPQVTDGDVENNRKTDSNCPVIYRQHVTRSHPLPALNSAALIAWLGVWWAFEGVCERIQIMLAMLHESSS